MFTFKRCSYWPIEKYIFAQTNRFPMDGSDDGIGALDVLFLIENLFHYNVIAARSKDDTEKEHALMQIGKIHEIFQKYGVRSDLVRNAVPFRNRKALIPIIVDASKGGKQNVQVLL